MSTQIHDLGYRAYTGERAGVAWAVRSLARHSVRRALGLKRAGKHKVVPIITILLTFVPALVLVGLTAFLPIDPEDLIGYSEYFGTITFALILFAAAVAPGVLTTDRTSGMLAMYLASPLNRTTYVLAKAIGIFSVLMLVCVGPILFLILANTLAGVGPGGPLDFLELFVRAAAAGTLTAAFFTGLSMFLSSIPKRWSIASVVIVGVLIVPSIIVGVLTEAGGAPDWVSLFTPSAVIGEAREVIFADRNRPEWALDRVSSTPVVLAAVGYTLASLGLTWWRYQTVEVDR